MEQKKVERVALISLGFSRVDYLGDCLDSCFRDNGTEWDEVWTVNAGYKVFIHDKLFAMDDLRVLTQQYPKYGESLKVHNKPIITSTAYKEFPTSVSYPIKEVLDLVGEDVWFSNTIVYAIAYALFTGVKSLHLYGADFQYMNLTHREEGAQAAAYLIGMARSKGMQTVITPTSTFLAASKVKSVEGHNYRPLYGYLRHPLIKKDSVAVEIQKGVGNPDGTIPSYKVGQGDGLTLMEPNLAALVEKHNQGLL